MIKVSAAIRHFLVTVREFEKAVALIADVATTPPLPTNILALLPYSYLHEQGAMARWAQRYENVFTACWIPRREYERTICALLALGNEPTVVLETFHICTEALSNARGRNDQ